MILSFRIALILSKIALVIGIIIIAIFGLAVAYVAQDDAELEREILMREVN